MSTNLVKRFQFCLNTDDAEIVRLGLDGFADQIAQCEAFSSTIAAVAITPSMVDVEFALQASDDIDTADFPMVELYVNSSPRLEELFSVWSLFTGRRELESALSVHFLRCFVFILQTLPMKDHRYLDITNRIFRDHETGLIRQLQSTDRTVVAYTMLLISLCIRINKSISESLLHALLTSFKSLHSNTTKPGKLPIYPSFCAVVLFGHFFTYLDYAQCLLVISEGSLLLDLLYHGSLPTLHLLLSIQRELFTTKSIIIQENIPFFINDAVVNKLLSMRSKLSSENFDAIINPYLQFIVEGLLQDLSNSTSTLQSKSIMSTIHSVLDNLVPQFDLNHQQIVFRALDEKPSLAIRCISTLKISDWTPATVTFELTQGLMYLHRVVSYLHYDVHADWSKNVRTLTAILSIIFPAGLSKKELVKLVTAFPTVEVQLLALQYVHKVLDVLTSHLVHHQLSAITLEAVEEAILDFKSLYQVRTRVVEAYQQQLLKQQQMKNDSNVGNTNTASNVIAIQEELTLDMDLNFEGTSDTSIKKKKGLSSSSEGPNHAMTISHLLSVEEEMQKIKTIVNEVIAVWMRTCYLYVQHFPSVLTISRVDWSKVVEDLILLSVVDKTNTFSISSVFFSETINICLSFFTLIIRPSTLYVWFGSEEENNKMFVNLLMVDWQTKTKLSLFGHLLKFAVLGVQNTSDGATTETFQLFLYDILSSLGLFQGHGPMELSLALEMSTWVMHICTTIVTARDNHQAMNKLLVMLDCLLRLSLRWRIDAAIACHECTLAMKGTYVWSAAPISPMAYIALSLAVGDLSIFASTFPGYIRKYWDLLSTTAESSATTSESVNVPSEKDNTTSSEVKTKDDAIQFFSRFVQGFRTILIDWLVPWLSEVLICHPQREFMVQYWQYLCDMKIPSHSQHQVITLVPIQETNLYHLLHMDHAQQHNHSLLLTSPISKQQKKSSSLKRRSLHGLPPQELKDLLLPQLPNTIPMVHILSKELPALLAFIRKQPCDAVALCLQSYVDEYAPYIRLQYFLENTSYRKVALDWISETWQKHKFYLTKTLSLLSSTSSVFSKKRMHPLAIIHIASLLKTLQCLQAFINDTATHYEESKEGVVTTALRVADELCVFLMDILASISTVEQTQSVKLCMDLLNMQQVIDFVGEASAYGMVCRRYCVSLLTQMKDISMDQYKASLVLAKKATEMFSTLLKDTNANLVDSTYVDLLACLLSLDCTPELLHVYFLLRFQVQANHNKVLASHRQEGNLALSTSVDVKIEANVELSKDLLWKGMQQLPMDTLWSLKEQLQETFASPGKSIVALYPHATVENGLSLMAPELLLLLQKSNINTNSIENNELQVAVQLTICYEKQFATSSEEKIASWHTRLRTLVHTYSTHFASTSSPVTSIMSMVTAIQFLVDITVKLCQEMHRLSSSEEGLTKMDMSTNHKALHTTAELLLELIQSLRFVTVQEISAITTQETISKQLQRWFKALLKYQLHDSKSMSFIRLMLLWCHHPGIISKCPKIKPVLSQVTSESMHMDGHDEENDHSKAIVLDFHHPMNLLDLIPRHSLFLSLISLHINTNNKNTISMTEESMKITRNEIMKLFLTLLQMLTQPAEWISFNKVTKDKLREHVAHLETTLLPYYQGTMASFDRLLLRMIQVVQDQGKTERLGRSWLQLLPMMPLFAKQNQQSSSSHHQKKLHSIDSSASSASSIIHWIQHAKVQRTISDFPEHRSVLPQVFLWEIHTFASANKSNNSSLPSTWSFAPTQISLKNEEERWQLLKHYQQPQYPVELQQAQQSHHHESNDQLPPGRYISPAQEKYLLRDYDKSLKQYQKWAQETDQDQQRYRKTMYQQHQLLLQDIDGTDMKNFVSMDEILDGMFMDMDMDIDEDMKEVYDPAFVLPAFLQCIVQPHEGDNKQKIEYNMRDLMSSGISSLMLRALSASCVMTRVYGYCFLDYLWQRLRESEAQQTLQKFQYRNNDNNDKEEGNDDIEDREEATNDNEEDDDGGDDDEDNKKSKKKGYYPSASSKANIATSMMFREKLFVDVFLRYIKDSIVQTQQQSSETSMNIILPPQLSSTSALFFARGLLILLHPKHEHYAMLTKMIASNPYHAHSEVPWFKTFIVQAGVLSTTASANAVADHAGEDNEGVAERLSALRFIRDTLRYHHQVETKNSLYPSTSQLLLHHQVYAHLLQHWSLFAQQQRDLRMTHCVLDIFERALGHPEAAVYLIGASSRAQDLVAFFFSQAIILPVNNHHHQNINSHPTYNTSTILNVMGGTYALRWLSLLRKMTALIPLLVHQQPQQKQHYQQLIEHICLQVFAVCTEQIQLYVFIYQQQTKSSHQNKHESFVSFLYATRVLWEELCTSLTMDPFSLSLSETLQIALVTSISNIFQSYPAWKVISTIPSTTSVTNSAEDTMWSFVRLLSFASSSLATTLTNSNQHENTSVSICWHWMLRQALLRAADTQSMQCNDQDWQRDNVLILCTPTHNHSHSTHTNRDNLKVTDFDRLQQWQLRQQAMVSLCLSSPVQQLSPASQSPKSKSSHILTEEVSLECLWRAFQHRSFQFSSKTHNHVGEENAVTILNMVTPLFTALQQRMTHLPHSAAIAETSLTFLISLRAFVPSMSFTQTHVHWIFFFAKQLFVPILKEDKVIFSDWQETLQRHIFARLLSTTNDMVQVKDRSYEHSVVMLITWLLSMYTRRSIKMVDMDMSTFIHSEMEKQIWQELLDVAVFQVKNCVVTVADKRNMENNVHDLKKKRKLVVDLTEERDEEKEKSESRRKRVRQDDKGDTDSWKENVGKTKKTRLFWRPIHFSFKF